MRDYRNMGLWSNVTAGQWNDWKWQLSNRITDTEQLGKIIDLSNTEKREINSCLEKFKMAITPYYSTLIDPGNPSCPVRMQSVPTINELQYEEHEIPDPLGEEADSPVENIVHRYPDRVLFLVTHKCSMYCRHCTRRRFVGCEDFSISSTELDKAYAYISNNPNIRDVLISGGDPLIMGDEYLERIISRLRNITHVEIIRIGTRIPVVLPMRITGELLGMLKKYHPVWINTHFNHPVELTEAATKACEQIVDAGIPLGNQSVLLKGINDNTTTLKELLLKLVKSRVRPYYLYQCDLGMGISHFRTAIDTGINIMRSLRGYISGYAVPTFVIDAPGGGGKIPVNPEYVVNIDEEQVILRNYRNKLYSYPNDCYTMNSCPDNSHTMNSCPDNSHTMNTCPDKEVAHEQLVMTAAGTIPKVTRVTL